MGLLVYLYFFIGGGGAPEEQGKVRGAFAQKRLRTTALNEPGRCQANCPAYLSGVL